MKIAVSVLLAVGGAAALSAATASIWDRIHPRLTHRGCCLTPDGALPVIEGRRRRSGGVLDIGQQLTGRGFVGGGNQHAYPLQLQLRFLASGIVCREGCPQAVAA